MCPCGGRPLPKGLHCYFHSRTTPPYPSVRVNGCGAFVNILNGALGHHNCRPAGSLSCDPQGWPAGRCYYLVSSTGTWRPRHTAREGGAGTDAGPHPTCCKLTCLQAPGGGLCEPRTQSAPSGRSAAVPVPEPVLPAPCTEGFPGRLHRHL